LQERDIDTLIVPGTLSQVCCEATARDAMMMNYKVFFISDAGATLTDAEHSGTLSAMAHTFCDVRDTQSMLDLIAAA
jgi:ureidoacrylate peracid hydrolase